MMRKRTFLSAKTRARAAAADTGDGRRALYSCQTRGAARPGESSSARRAELNPQRNFELFGLLDQ